MKKVIDGDTIILADERHVRLLGINTPEIGRDGRASEAGAESARAYLARLLRTHDKLHLRYDTERHDQYQRTLAHLFLPDGINLQALMLGRGLATTVTIPPNLDFQDCYQASVAAARADRIGLWALADYQPLPAGQLSREKTGYRIVTGEVSRIGESRSAVWINLGRHFAVRITRDDLVYFDARQIQDLVGRTILVQGWLYLGNNEYRMRVRHPHDLQVLEKN